MNHKKRVGITGQSGFIGTPLFNTLGLFPDRFERVPFEDCFFEDQSKLNAFVKSCDVIVHLAAMNRYNDMQVIYDTNVGLVEKLISACETLRVLPHIIYSSSIHENWDNLYGKSKRVGRELFEQWARRNNGARFSGFVMPNVFGPYGRPYFNSVVATFCYLLTHDGKPKIDVDNDVTFIYVADIVKRLIDEIELVASVSIIENVRRIDVPAYKRIKVSELLSLLDLYKVNYFEKGSIPSLNTSFERDLFNTFLGYIDHSSFFPFRLKSNSDERGSFVEIPSLVLPGGSIFIPAKLKDSLC
jgi:UDP-2-acetamido-2,6-beta-L-arabino-hexul-4-ose reductase